MMPHLPTKPTRLSRPQLASRLLMLAAVASATGCASPKWQSVVPGASEAELQARGRAHEVYQFPDGSRRWLYPAPGETRWAADIGPDGQVVSVRQMLSAEEFGRARIGEWTTRDVLTRFGKPAEISRFARMHRRSLGLPVRARRHGVRDDELHFDPAGVLRPTQVIPDFRTVS
ncbi:dethiobiotin synthetase [Cupriavidus basilensis]